MKKIAYKGMIFSQKSCIETCVYCGPCSDCPIGDIKICKDLAKNNFEEFAKRIGGVMVDDKPEVPLEEKPIQDWTLSDCQEYCRTFMRTIEDGQFCEEQNCELHNRGICSGNWVHDWDMRNSKLTQEEINILNAMLVIDPDIEFVTVRKDGVLVCHSDNNPTFLWPTILQGKLPHLTENVQYNINKVIEEYYN